jgi:hypothetical protein
MNERERRMRELAHLHSDARNNALARFALFGSIEGAVYEDCRQVMLADEVAGQALVDYFTEQTAVCGCQEATLAATW